VGHTEDFLVSVNLVDLLGHVVVTVCIHECEFAPFDLGWDHDCMFLHTIIFPGLADDIAWSNHLSFFSTWGELLLLIQIQRVDENASRDED